MDTYYDIYCIYKYISSHPSLGFSAFFFLNVIRTTEILKLTEVLRLPFGHFDQERVREVDASGCRRILGGETRGFFLGPEKAWWVHKFS